MWGRETVYLLYVKIATSSRMGQYSVCEVFRLSDYDDDELFNYNDIDRGNTVVK